MHSKADTQADSPGLADTEVAQLRERLAGQLADWGAEFSAVLNALQGAQRELHERDDHIAELSARLDTAEQQAQNNSEIERLTAELATQEAELGDRDEQLRLLREQNSQLHEQLDSVAQAQAELQHRDAEITRIRRQKKQADDHVAELLEELRSLRESTHEDASNEAAEIAALRAELDARKTLVKSLRADAERVAALDTLLEEKNRVVQTLEDSLNRQSETMAELKRNAEFWKNKYRGSQGDHGSTTTITSRRPDTEQVSRMLEAAGGEDVGDRTIAIDMRQALLEARRVSGSTPRKS